MTASNSTSERLCINALALKTGGGLSYVAELVPRIQAIHGTGNTIVLLERTQARALGWEGQPGITSLPRIFANPVPRMLFELLALPGLLAVWRCRSVLMCGNLGMPFCPARQIVVQHASFHAAASSRAILKKLKWRLLALLTKASARGADAVIYVSAALQSELKQRGFPAGTVIRHGVNSLFRPMARPAASAHVRSSFKIDNPFVLCVGDIYTHKQVQLAIRVAAEISTQRNSALDLVVAGGHSDPAEVTRLRNAADKLEFARHFHLLGTVTREDLPYLYNAADAVLMASSAESFGMPILEALACGAPVACSRIPAFEEVAGAAGFFFPPGDVTAAVAATLRCLEVERPYAAGVRHAAEYSWEAAAQATLNVMVQSSGAAA